jgi:hypothetical protein
MNAFPYTASAVQIEGLLYWNTGNDMHFAEFHIGKHFRTYTEHFFREIHSFDK